MNDARTAYLSMVGLICTRGLAARAEVADSLVRLTGMLPPESGLRTQTLAAELDAIRDFQEAWSWLERLGAALAGAVLPPDHPSPAWHPPVPPADGDHMVRWVAPALEPRVLADFFGEVSEHLEEASHIVVAVGENDPDTIQELYRKLHTVKGNCGMVGLGELQEVAHRLEDLVKGMREARRGPTGEERRVLAEGLQLGLAVLDLAQSGKAGAVPLGRFRSDVAALVASGTALAPRATVPPFAAQPSVPPKPLPAAAQPSVPPHPQPASAPPSVPPPVLGACIGSAGGAARKTLRVDFGEVDRLALLVGEQSVRQEEALRQIGRLEDRVDDLFRGLDVSGGVRESLSSARQELGLMASELEGTARSLDLVSGDIQRRVFDLRMVPLDALFERHRMTVYQAAVSQGKQARLVIEAGDARIDKNIAEKLDEPMVHLLRNAVSHGIALPAERVRTGKPAEGKVTVRAFSKGSQVVVEVEDDGVGIVPEVLRRKAVEKGFLSEEECRKLDDSRIVDLIFAPGFSTTSQVNDVSGRGVGLDVVRNQVARVGGAVEIECRPGQGAVFRLTLPLTLAVARVLMVQVAGEPVALPADSVVRVETVPVDSLVEAAGRAMVRIGAETFPFVRLANLLELWDGADLRAEHVVCIVRHGDRMGALVVDRVMDHTQAVVREAGPLLPQIPHCMGVSVLEGRAVLIVDVGAVLRSWAGGTAPDGAPLGGRFLLVGLCWDRHGPLLRQLPRRPGPVLVSPSLLGPALVREAALIVVAADLPDLERVLETVAAAESRAPVVLVTRGASPLGLDRLYQWRVDHVLDIESGLERALEVLARSGGRR